MAQFSMEIIYLTGSVLRGNQHTALFDKQKEVDEMVQNAWPVVMGSATE